MARTTVRFKPSNVLVERGAQRSFALAFLATHRRRWCLCFCLASPPAIFIPSGEHPRPADRSADFFWPSRGFSAFLALLLVPHDDVASTNI